MIASTSNNRNFVQQMLGLRKKSFQYNFFLLEKYKGVLKLIFYPLTSICGVLECGQRLTYEELFAPSLEQTHPGRRRATQRHVGALLFPVSAGIPVMATLPLQAVPLHTALLDLPLAVSMPCSASRSARMGTALLHASARPLPARLCSGPSGTRRSKKFLCRFSAPKRSLAPVIFLSFRRVHTRTDT